MSYSFVQKITGILFRPAQTFRNLEDEHPGTALIHFLKLSVLFSALMTAALYALPHLLTPKKWEMASQFFQPLDFFAVLAVITIGVPLLVGIWLHLWVFLFGGRGGIGQTLKTAMYSYTPFFVIVWIPVIGLFGGALSTLYPQAVGIRELHQISARRANGAVVAAAFFPAVALVGILIMAIFAPATLLPFLSTGAGSPAVPDCPYLLNQSDLPAEITYFSAHEVDEEIIMRDARDLGCLKEYTETYADEKPSSATSRRITHFVLIFPPGNAVKMVQEDDAFYSGLVPPRDAEKLPTPDLGDICISYRTPGVGPGTNETYDNSYCIAFAKGEVYERFITIGPDPDYDLLKDLAQRAAAKIP